MVAPHPREQRLVREACEADPRLADILDLATSWRFAAEDLRGSKDHAYNRFVRRAQDLVGAHRVDGGPAFLGDEETHEAFKKELARRLCY